MSNELDTVGRLYSVLHQRMVEFFAGDQGISAGDKDAVHLNADQVTEAALMLIGSVMSEHPHLREARARKLYCIQQAIELDMTIQAAQQAYAERSPYDGRIGPH